MNGYTVPTAPRPAGEGWQRVPSVTYGGARYFWHRRNPETGALEWFAYDRAVRTWRHTSDR